MSTTIYTGAAGSGKTTALVNNITQQLEATGDTTSIRILAATHQSAYLTHKMLPENLVVQTIEDLSLEIIRTAGYDVHVLKPFEEDMICLDMIVERDEDSDENYVKAMAVIEDIWAGIDVEDVEDWVDEFNTMLNGKLEQLGAVFRVQLPYFAAGLVENVPEVAKAFHTQFMYVDDYQDLSAEAQRMVTSLADELIVAGNPAQAVSHARTIPNPSGIAELSQTQDAQVVELTEYHRVPAAAAKAATSLASHMAVDCPAFPENDQSGVLTSSYWQEAAHETQGYAKMAYNSLNNWKNPEAVNAKFYANSDLLFVVPDRETGIEMSRALKGTKFKVTGLFSPEPINEDPTLPGNIGGKPEGSDGYRTMTMLSLIANPMDAMAWRAWFGLGTQDLGAVNWFLLSHFAKDNAMDIFSAVQALDEEEFEGAEELVALRDIAFNRFDAAEDKTGLELLQAAAGSKLTKAVWRTITHVDESPDIDTMIEHVDYAWLGRTLVDDYVHMRIVTPENATGLQSKLTYVLSMVDDRYPGEEMAESPAMMDAARAGLYLTLTRSEDETWIGSYRSLESYTAPSRLLYELGDSVAGLLNHKMLPPMQ